MYMSRDNYVDKAIDEVYSLLVVDKQKWPTSISLETRRKFLNDMLDYYEGMDEFEKCVEIRNIINGMENHQHKN